MLHDFSGHPFQAQLARNLSTRDFDVTHVYCASFQTPTGDVGDEGRSTPRHRSIGLSLRRPFHKYSAIRRALQELEYGWRVSRQVRKSAPDVIISANTPLIAALVLQVTVRLRRIPMVFWQQDIYSVAMRQHFERRAGFVGRLVGNVFVTIERWLLRSSPQIVVISEDFLDTLHRWGVPDSKVTVIENWAPLDEVPVRERRNDWSRGHGLDDDTVVLLYAGTLGLKHKPEMLLGLARAFADRDDVRVIVASEGLGATWLRDQGADEVLELIEFQPYAELPDMLGSGDVLMVLLEADAGVFSVPSKVLTYHCAGRPILGAIPSENLAARIMEREGSGCVVDPGDVEAFVAAARRLVDDETLRTEMGAAARAYAEATFDIERITDEFISILEMVAPRRPDAVSAP